MQLETCLDIFCEHSPLVVRSYVDVLNSY